VGIPRECPGIPRVFLVHSGKWEFPMLSQGNPPRGIPMGIPDPEYVSIPKKSKIPKKPKKLPKNFQNNPRDISPNWRRGFPSEPTWGSGIPWEFLGNAYEAGEAMNYPPHGHPIPHQDFANQNVSYFS
jgi:hypothetical protein